VPISNLPQIIEEMQKDIEAQGIKYLTVGHAGDGEFWLEEIWTIHLSSFDVQETSTRC
jgi:FAD/FMN-containing dehydrogenase